MPACCMLSHFSHSYSVPPCGLQPARLFCPCDSPGKNTGVGCCALLQGIFPTQELNLLLLHVQPWQVGSLLHVTWDIYLFIFSENNAVSSPYIFICSFLYVCLCPSLFLERYKLYQITTHPNDLIYQLCKDHMSKQNHILREWGEKLSIRILIGNNSAYNSPSYTYIYNFCLSI